MPVALLSDDAELAEAVPAAARRAATTAAVALELVVQPGTWTPASLPARRQTGFGVMLLEGLVARDVGLADQICTELLGAGDVVTPWRADEETLLLPSTEWTALEPTVLALLDSEFVAAVSPFPALVEKLFERAARRSARLATHQAIAQLPRVDLRLLALFWHLAERWGRIGREGVVLPLALPHRMLGRLVGARRPTVSLALRDLSERGLIRRRADGSWQLARQPPGALVPERHEEPPGRIIVLREDAAAERSRREAS